MSKTFGIEFTIGIPASVDEIDEKVDSFYLSLADNFALVNVDTAWNAERGSLSALLAVTSPRGLNAESYATGVASDAFRTALLVSGLVQTSETSFTPSARVRELQPAA
jgi:hypothetical protein